MTKKEALEKSGYSPKMGRPKKFECRIMLPPIAISKATESALIAYKLESGLKMPDVRRMAYAAFLTEEVSK